MINFKEFKKMDLRVARVIEAEKIEESDNLLKLQVDLGEDPSTGSGQGTRQIIAGIAKFYKSEDLVGKEIAIVANLEPKIVFGVESKGMLLAAENENEVVLLIPEKEVPPGTKIH